MSYRDNLDAAHQEIDVQRNEIEKQREEISTLESKVERMRKKKERKKMDPKVKDGLIDTVIVILCIFAYVSIGGIVASWTEYNFCTKASPCSDRSGIVISGVVWPIGVLVNVGKHSYEFVSGKGSGHYK